MRYHPDWCMHEVSMCSCMCARAFVCACMRICMCVCGPQVGDGSMEAAFELLHLYLTEPVWSEEALRRAKTHYINNKGSVSKSLEKATAEKVRTVSQRVRNSSREPFVSSPCSHAQG